MKTRFVATVLLAWAMTISVGRAQQPDLLPGQLPVSESPSIQYYQYQTQPLTVAQQRARFEAEQRLYRMEWNNWAGYSPLRPTLNASYMSAIAPRYFVPSRGVLVHTGQARSWYW